MGTKIDPCAKIIRKMYLMLEGGESASLCESLRSHLEGCPSCAGQYRVLEDLVSLCQRFPAEEVSEEEKQKIKEELRKSFPAISR